MQSDLKLRAGAATLVTFVVGVLAASLMLAGCSADDPGRTPSQQALTSRSSAGEGSVPSPRPSGSAVPLLREPAPFRHRLPGMPPVLRNNVYAATGAGMLAPAVARDPALLYVPDAGGSAVTVISQRTHKIVRVLKAGLLSQHVNPSYDLSRLYVDSSAGNELVTIDPRTARVRGTARVPRPYNLYFTPDGKQAIVIVEEHDRVRFVDRRSFRLLGDYRLRGCRGPNHADFSANGRYFVLTCEFSGAIVKVSTQTHRVLAMLRFGTGSMPQDVRLSPDGRIFYVADMAANRVRLIDGARFRQIRTIITPKQPHGLYPSRDGSLLYVSDRGAGKVSVVSFAGEKIVDTWTIPGGGSPDMGGVSADGKVLWLTGRYDGVVYGFATRSGRLIARIHVGGNPHGMAVWPQPGRYSLGHTGNMR